MKKLVITIVALVLVAMSFNAAAKCTLSDSKLFSIFMESKYNLREKINIGKARIDDCKAAYTTYTIRSHVILPKDVKGFTLQTDTHMSYQFSSQLYPSLVSTNLEGGSIVGFNGTNLLMTNSSIIGRNGLRYIRITKGIIVASTIGCYSPTDCVIEEVDLAGTRVTNSGFNGDLVGTVDLRGGDLSGNTFNGLKGNNDGKSVLINSATKLNGNTFKGNMSGLDIFQLASVGQFCNNTFTGTYKTVYDSATGKERKVMLNRSSYPSDHHCK